MLYPAELQAHMWLQHSTEGASKQSLPRATTVIISHLKRIYKTFLMCVKNLPFVDDGKAGDGNRTHVAGLEGQNSTIELHPQKSGRRDSNPRPHGPKPRTLPNCATPRQRILYYHRIGATSITDCKFIFYDTIFVPV